VPLIASRKRLRNYMVVLQLLFHFSKSLLNTGTKGRISRSEGFKSVFGRGSVSHPTGGAYDAPQIP